MTNHILEAGYLRYQRQLEEALIEGQLQDPILVKRYGFPKKLDLQEVEQTELECFVINRVEDLFKEFVTTEEVSPMVIGHFVMNSVVAGMLWEMERKVDPLPELENSA